MPSSLAKIDDVDSIENQDIDENVLEEYKRLLKECDLTINKIKKRKNARQRSIQQK